jgi:hypothetical protein
MEPGQHEDLGADGEVAGRFGHVDIEDQPRVRRAFGTLFGCVLGVGEGRLDVANGSDLVASCHHGRGV